jgi:hypothetical protein
MHTAEETAKMYEKIQSIAANNNDAPRRIEAMQIGQVVRQGDVYIHRVSADHPKGDKLKSRQLAVGSTKGARHVAEPPAAVYQGIMPPPDCDSTLLGPRIDSERRFTISHPEHPDFSLPAGAYQVTHQMDARTMKRTQD